MPKRMSSETPELVEYGLRTMIADTVVTRVLDFLILYRDSSYSISEIARNSHVSWCATHQVLPKLLSIGIIKEEDNYSRAKSYKFNGNSLLAKKLIELTVEYAILCSKKSIFQNSKKGETVTL